MMTERRWDDEALLPGWGAPVLDRQADDLRFLYGAVRGLLGGSNDESR